MTTETYAMQAILAVYQNSPDATDAEVFDRALRLAGLAERFDYVARVKSVDPEGLNLHEVFPEWQGEDWSVATLRLKSISQPRTNSGTLMNKWGLVYEIPQGWDQKSNPEVSTDWFGSSWVVDAIAQRARASLGVTCRWYWRTFKIDNGNKARQLVWIEPLEEGTQAPATAPEAAPPAAQNLPSVVPPEPAPAPPEEPTGGGDVSRETADALADLQMLLADLREDQATEVKERWKRLQIPAISSGQLTIALIGQATEMVCAVQSEMVHSEEPF